MKVIKYCIIFSLLILFYNNCTVSFESNSVEDLSFDLEESSVSQSNKLASEVHNILNKNCASCHSPELNFGGISDILNLSPTDDRAQIKAIINSIESDRMPPSGRKLTVVEKSMIKDWSGGKRSYSYNESYQCHQVALNYKKSNENKLWLINKEEFKNIVSDVFGYNATEFEVLPDPFINHGFKTNNESMIIDDFVFSRIQNIAESVATKVTSDSAILSKVWSCGNFSKTSSTKECVESFINNKIGQLFRKSISAAERTKFYNIYMLSSKEDEANLKGVKDVIFAALISPYFLYKKELIKGASQIDKNYMIAEDLAFHIYKSVPDQALMDAAKRGELVSIASRKLHVNRMLRTAKGKLFFNKFISDYFNIDYLEGFKPNEKLSLELKNQYLSEFNSFVDGVMQSDKKLSSLLSKTETNTQRELASLVYNLQPTAGNNNIKHDYKDRSGILTLPAFLLSNSTVVRNIPPHIVRGVFVREKLLCHELGAPPSVDDPVVLVESAAKVLNARERFERSHLTKKDCKSCHALIDPIGFGLAYFNDFGKIEPLDIVTKRPVDKTGYVKFTANTNFKFTDAPDLSRKLASSKDVSDCFVEQTYEYLKGSKVKANNLCELEKHKTKFLSSGGNMFDLVVSILTESSRYNLAK